MSIIHIAPDIEYLFNQQALVLCGRTAKEVFADSEAVGVRGNLNPKCRVCPKCAEVANAPVQA